MYDELNLELPEEVAQEKETEMLQQQQEAHMQAQQRAMVNTMAFDVYSSLIKAEMSEEDMIACTKKAFWAVDIFVKQAGMDK